MKGKKRGRKVKKERLCSTFTLIRAAAGAVVAAVAFCMAAVWLCIDPGVEKAVLLILAAVWAVMTVLQCKYAAALWG